MPTRLLVTVDGQLDQPPHRHGSALHGAVLAALHRHNPNLAKRFHPPSQPHSPATPLALTPLRPAASGSEFELGLVDDELADPVADALTAAQLTIHDTSLRVSDLSGVHQPFTDLVNHAPPVTAWTFTLHSPTCLRIPHREGIPERTEPVPHPTLAFDRLRRRWDRLSPVPLPGDDRIDATIKGWLAIAAAQLHTVRHTTKPPRGWAPGAVGSIVYTLLQPNRAQDDVRSGLSALSRFAALAGLGDHTSRGMGHVSVRPATRSDMASSF